MSHADWSRRAFVKATGWVGVVGGAGGTGGAGLGLMGASETEAAVGNDRSFVYVGTYTKKKSRGIYRFRFDRATGALSDGVLAAETPDPSFLAVHPNGRWLYAVNELMSFGGEVAGSVSAFKIDPATGDLSELGRARSTHGGAPCYVSVDPTGKWVLAANYNGGNLAVLPIGSNGALGNASHVVQHKGSSVNEKRQGEPHAHSILPDPGSAYVFAADLGIDKVLGYRLDSAKGKLVAHTAGTVKMGPGAGPRHLAISEDGKHAYAINELDSTITVLDYDRAGGSLTKDQTVSTLPKGFKERSSCADIHLSPNGRFLYGSNRGHNSIAAFEVNPKNGRLKAIGHTPTGGETPRNFGIDPSGRFLLAANQNSDTVVTFKIDQTTGRLTPTDAVSEVPTPVCVRFVSL